MLTIKVSSILLYSFFLIIHKSDSAPTHQHLAHQFYNPYYQPYQWPYQYYQDSQYIVPYINADNTNSIANEDVHNYLWNIIESTAKPTTTEATTTSTEASTTDSTTKTIRVSTTTIKSPQTTINWIQQACLEKCIHRPPSQYDPVCGSDNETYFNEGRLDCAVDCGVDVTLASRGTCTPMTTMIGSGLANSAFENL